MLYISHRFLLSWHACIYTVFNKDAMFVISVQKLKLVIRKSWDEDPIYWVSTMLFDRVYPVIHTRYTYTLYIHVIHTRYTYTLYIHVIHTRYTYTMQFPTETVKSSLGNIKCMDMYKMFLQHTKKQQQQHSFWGRCFSRRCFSKTLLFQSYMSVGSSKRVVLLQLYEFTTWHKQNTCSKRWSGQPLSTPRTWILNFYIKWTSTISIPFPWM